MANAWVSLLRHWRYISSFHGPWLQLPPEVLESLAYSNYASPRPRPIDPAVFFDLVKIRRLVEEATDLAVRAANGTTSSSLSNALNASNGLWTGGNAAALGLGLGGGGGTAKLSRERKHRMREHATQKLSKAYHLDEIAASVATMQSASALEDVARLVLQRQEDHSDAKYVHFFHEKIPSRMLAQCTSLKPLDEVIADRPHDGAPFRTRAVTRTLKDDCQGAVKDLTEGLHVCRFALAQHQRNNGELVLASALEEQRKKGYPREWDIKIDEKDHPSSLEPQLLFNRAGVYLSIACGHIHAALNGQKPKRTSCPTSNGKCNEPANGCSNLNGQGHEADVSENDAHPLRLEARKVVKTNAKRALRDYMAFLSHLDYTPGLPTEFTEEFLRKVNATANGTTKHTYSSPRNNRSAEKATPSDLTNGQASDAIARRRKSNERHLANGNVSVDYTSYPSLPTAKIYPVSDLFSATPPADLPSYPNESTALTARSTNDHNSSTDTPLSKTLADSALLANHDCHEAVTYHPLLTDALHSLLLTHALLQTSPKEVLRHAHMVARLARVCDGYPIFLAARSPSRADWIEVIRRSNNWLGLKQSWESLCAPAPLPGDQSSTEKKETEEEVRKRRKHEAVIEALADERVDDEKSFRAAVRAREMRAEEQRREEAAFANGNGNEHGKGEAPKRWAQEDGKEYPISTERADAIGRWIREAPLTVEGAGGKKRSGKKKVRRSGAGKVGVPHQETHHKPEEELD